MRIVTQAALAFVSLAALGGLQSCATMATGSENLATFAYVTGTLSVDVEGSPQKVVRAADQAIEDMEMHKLSSDSTSIDGKVTANTALGKQVEITVNRKDDMHSKLSIHIGSLGDKELSLAIYEKIKARL